MNPATPSTPAPGEHTTLGAQFRSQALAYVTGAVMLGGFQLAMNRIDWLSKAAVEAIFGPDPAKAWRPAAFILGLAVVAFVTRVASRLLVFNAGRDIEYELRRLLLDRLHTLGTAFYRKMSAGEIMSRATNDLQQVRLLFGFGVLNLVNVVFAFASALQVMLTISVFLTLGCLANLPLIVLISRWVSRAMFVRTRENQQSLGALSDCVQGNLAGVRVVRSFALEERERARFDGVNRRYLHASLALARVRVLGPMLGAASGIGIIVFFWYGSHLVLQGALTSGAFYAFWQAFVRMTWPMLALGFAITMIQRGRAGYSRLKDVFDARPEVVDGPLPAPPHLGGSLRIEGLSFAYGERVVLDGVGFELEEGASLAILGRTGSGKSTLAMLLARLLPTPPGAVRIDGKDVCDLPLSSVRSAIGYAQQDAFLFSTTVSRNIGFSLDDPDSSESLQKIRDAAREAQVLEETLGLAEQFDTVVGERGVQLSGGQKQRIALARALVWEPKILVLDDPLSAVDAKTEAAILDAIDRQAEKRTVVLITHRVAAAARCDSILVLDHGRVIERGTHEELVRAGGLYAAFAEEQRMATELEALAVDDAAEGSPSLQAEGGAE
jgi:ATP-binding cassette, subfamily B, multidrug efflux pump